jgi:membrane-associated phospholipid phosphatase
MRDSELVNLVYFALVTLLALVKGLPRESRFRAVLLGLAGLAATGTAVAAGRLALASAEIIEIVRDWLPVPLMAMAYWQSGCFFQRENPRLQAIFETSDEWLRNALGRLWPGGLGRISFFLELAYLLCYPTVPLGLAALYLSGLRHYADHYWLVVLLATYPCYVLLPFVPLLPPRRMPARESSVIPGRLRHFNIWIVRRVTHQANTFPSGHVAATTAIALVLVRLTPMTGVVFAVIAAGIALGCVSGRYHYALDVITAVLLSVAVFVIVISL